VLIAVVLLSSAAGSPASAENDTPARLLGVWEYRQAAGSGFDPEGERLQFSRKGQSIHGVYLGLEREGEHGLFYTAVEMKSLTVSPTGEIAFVVPPRELFHERPESVADATQKAKTASAGFTKDELHLQGRITGATLTLACVSKAQSCPEAVMVFKKSGR
jgi:hypothetical protein